MKFFKTNRIYKVQNLIIFGIGLSLVIFTSYKSAITSFTHDESFTYLNYVHQKFLHIISFKKPYTNNHILNTIFIKCSEKIFGNSEFALRIPNILALITYLTFTYLILQKEKKILLPLFILMTFNPFLLDFFGLARGYGLSICFMMMSIYYLVDYFDRKSTNRSLILFNFAALLAILANFTMLNFYLAALITFNFLTLKNSTDKSVNTSLKRLLKTNNINLLSLLFSTLILFEPIRRLWKVGKLDYGAKSLMDTLRSQVYNALYDVPISGSLRDFLTYLIILFIGGNLIVTAVNFIGKRRLSKNSAGLFISNWILILILTATTTQHYLFQNDYFKDRFALFLYPLIGLNIFSLLKYFLSTRLKYPVFAISFLSIPFLCWNMYANINLHSYKDWRYDMNTKQMLAKLENQITPSKNNIKVKLGVDWLFEPTINYYRITKNLNWLAPVERDGFQPTDDYHYILTDDLVVEKSVISSWKIVGKSKNSVLKENQQ